MDMKYIYILLLTLIITMTLVNRHIINPGVEIGRFMNKLVSRFSVNINIHTHMSKHIHLPIIIFFLTFTEDACRNE